MTCVTYNEETKDTTVETGAVNYPNTPQSRQMLPSTGRWLGLDSRGGEEKGVGGGVGASPVHFLLKLRVPLHLLLQPRVHRALLLRHLLHLLLLHLYLHTITMRVRGG